MVTLLGVIGSPMLDHGRRSHRGAYSMMGNLRARSQDAPAKVHEYRRCFGSLKGIFKCLTLLIIPSLNGRCVSVAVPNSSAHVLLRLGTTDIAVFNSIFRSEEYGMRLPSQPGVIVDAGTYTALSAVYFTLRYPEARIVALEPSGSNFELLQRNTQHLSNVQAVNAALWAKSGRITLTDSGDGAWAFRVSGDLDVRRSPYSVMPGSAPEAAATTG